jgi:hypothetical protein
MSNGHATPGEVEELDRLRVRVKGNVSLDDLLDLGQLYLEPFHREEIGVAIARLALMLCPGNARASTIFAHGVMVIEPTDPSLREAAALLRAVPDTAHKYKAAANVLLSGILQDLDELDPAEELRLLEQSVSMAPSWVRNRLFLAEALAAAGRVHEAHHQVEAASGNLLNPEGISVIDRSFHDLFTGRLSSVEDIEAVRTRFGKPAR